MKNNQPIIDRYQIGDLLGQGGMGAVYQATDLETGGYVAVKILDPGSLTGDPQAVGRFNREAQALRELDHPNIVRVLASIEKNGIHYLVMDFVSGGSLDVLIKRQGALDTSRMLEIGLDLADALTRTHRLGIIHRDLKPANILLDNDGTARLSDFGIALMTKSPHLTESNNLAGTLHYMSPEACRGQSASERSDIWAFGIVLYEMLTGDIPFHGNDPLELITAITTQPLPDFEAQTPDATAALVDLIYRLLEKDPDRRIPSVRIVGAELETISQGRESLLVKSARSRFADQSPSQEDLYLHNMPAQVTPFIGRETELMRLSELISDRNTRLVTILGQGGMGKTRLALQLAQNSIAVFEDGNYFVSLAPLNRVEDFVPEVAAAVGLKFHDSREPMRQLLSHLRYKEILLVLDNFEHLLNGAVLVSEILQAAPGVKALVTSREKLNLPGETIFRIDGLQFPTSKTEHAEMLDYSAVRLFMQEVKRLQPGFELDSEDLVAVNDICRFVDGMPLGILLAASWIELLTPQEISSEVRKNLDFLETDQRGVPGRQRSLRTIFEYSWKKLSKSEQQVFNRLSVFRGGFNRQAAQMVTSASIKQLGSLVNKSLVERDVSSGRFQMHELLRQYALEKLSESSEIQMIRNAHCQYFSEFLHQQLEHIRGQRQFKTLADIGVEFENVKQAWAWAVQTKNYDAVINSVETLYIFCEWLNRFDEGEALFQMARISFMSTENDQPHPAWNRVLLPWFDLRVEGRGSLDEYKTITSQAKTALAAAKDRDDKIGTAYAYVLLGAIGERIGTVEDSITNYENGLEAYPDIGDSFWVLIRLGLCYRKIDDQTKSMASFEQSLARGRELEDRVKIAWSQFNLGESIFKYRKRLNNRLLDELHHRWSEANELFQQVGSPAGQIWTSSDMMLVEFLQGDFAAVKNLAERILSIVEQIEYTSYGIAQAYGMLAYVAIQDGDYQSANKFFLDWLSTKPNMDEATRSYAAILQPTILVMILHGAAILLVNQGKFEQAIKLLAAVFRHPSCPEDLLDEWLGFRETCKKLQNRVGLKEFETFWAQGSQQDINVQLEKLYLELKLHA